MKLVIFLFFCLAVQLFSQTSKNNLNIVETEYAFAASAIEKGIDDSFLEFMDEESIVFNPHPASGKDVYSSEEKSPGFLIWYPSFSVLSSAGDLGVNSGPWEYKKEMEADAVAFGNFVSVWKRQGDGSYKFVIDFGNSNKKPQNEIPMLKSNETRRLASDKIVSAGESREIIFNLERELSKKSTEDGAVALYKSIVNPDSRFITSGMYPVFGDAIVDTIGVKSPYRSWEPIDGMGSVSGDFGYTYGTADVWNDSQMMEKKISLYYMHIWENTGDGWKLLVEVNSVIPKEKIE